MKRFIDYNAKLKERTKELQKAMTVPEKKLRFDFFKKLEQIYNTKNLLFVEKG
ncbi:MAG: hypothetical protein PHR68_04855 [Candidatus Gracilibacteria bacterium]|nr:hypothetical protein [Candidatus Gracilibacteria bacterium]